MSDKKYPIGCYAPGNYQCKCCDCGSSFLGDKRAVQCEPCAVANKERFDAMSPDEQKELMQRNAEAIREVFKNWGKKPDVNLAIIGHGEPVHERHGGSAVWVKAIGFKYEVGVAYNAKDATSRGAGKFDVYGQFIWGDGSITLPRDWNDLFILDESNEQPVEQKENEAVAFAEWLSLNYDIYGIGFWRPNEVTIDDPVYNTEQLYNEYQKQNKR